MKPLALALAAATLLAFSCSQAPRGAAVQETAKKPALYHCPMHPTFTSDKPGTCPICGMGLVLTDVAELEGHAPAAVPGRGAVTLSAERRQLLGVRSEAVRRGPLSREIRTVGLVAIDERRLHHVHTKFDGYVEHLYVDFTGKFVNRGDHLLSIYSPELVATQQEYLLAYRGQKRLAQSGLPSVEQGARDLLDAARQRLLSWDIRAEDIAELERSGQVQRTLDLHAEISGYVMAKQAQHGMRVTPAMELFDIADLSHLWVLADVYESDLPLVRLGLPAELSLPYLPGKSWSGPVTFIDPTVEEKTRTVKVRVEVDNQGEQLKPGMFADVRLRAEAGEGLLLPDSAVIDAGERKLVFLDRGEGRFEPRQVVLGPRTGESFQVLEGLAEGDRVVTAASFLLDSESSLKAVIASMTAGPAPAHQH
jgi:Cu(I)/Ag(I) efflux system membrane fusion protein